MLRGELRDVSVKLVSRLQISVVWNALQCEASRDQERAKFLASKRVSLRKTMKIHPQPATTTANIIFPVRHDVTVDTD